MELPAAAPAAAAAAPALRPLRSGDASRCNQGGHAFNFIMKKLIVSFIHRPGSFLVLHVLPWYSQQDSEREREASSFLLPGSCLEGEMEREKERDRALIRAGEGEVEASARACAPCAT